MQGLDEHMALGLNILRQGVKQMLNPLFSNQRKIADDRVEPACVKPTGGNILVGTELKPATTDSLRFCYQFGHNVNTNNLDSTIRKRARQPPFPAAHVEHTSRRQARNSLDYGLVGDQRPTFNLLVLDGFRPGTGVRMPRSNDLFVAEFRHRVIRKLRSLVSLDGWNAEQDEPVGCPTTSEMKIGSPPTVSPPGDPQR